MDATIRICDQPAQPGFIPKGFLAGTNLSLHLERGKKAMAGAA